MNELTYAGPSAPVVAEIIIDMTGYLSGPGYHGFLAWLDQNYSHCHCGKSHAPDAGSVRANLENLRAATAAARDNPTPPG